MAAPSKTVLLQGELHNTKIKDKQNKQNAVGMSKTFPKGFIFLLRDVFARFSSFSPTAESFGG